MGAELTPDSTLVLLIRLVVTAVVVGDKDIIGNGVESFRTPDRDYSFFVFVAP